MRKMLPIALIAFFVLIAAHTVRAQENLPSEESIRKLLNLLEWKKMHEAFLQGLELSVSASLRQMFHAQNDSQEKALSTKAAEIAAKIKEELKPEKVESIYIGIYRKNLTRREVEDMIAYYSSETGKSVMVKMPLINKQVGEAIQPRAEAVFSEQVRQELAPLLRRQPGME
jgi:hypothetical protein